MAKKFLKKAIKAHSRQVASTPQPKMIVAEEAISATHYSTQSSSNRQVNGNVGLWKNKLYGSENDSQPINAFGRSSALRQLEGTKIPSVSGKVNKFDSSTINSVKMNSESQSYKLTLKSAKDIYRIKGSIGSMEQESYSHALPKFVLDTQNDADVLIIDQHLGSVGQYAVNERRYDIDMGKNDDVLLVGNSNTQFDAVFQEGSPDYTVLEGGVNGNWKRIDTRYSFPVSEKENGKGGRIANANVDMGDGNDHVIVLGEQGSAEPAVSYAQIALGEGNNRMIVASGENVAGAIGNGSHITAGAGKDDLQAGELRGNALVELGGGDDTAEIKLMTESGRLEMGAGQDHIRVQRMEGGMIDGGEGSDTVTLGANQSHSNAYFRAIENVELTENSELDIRLADLLQNATLHTVEGKEVALVISANGRNNSVYLDRTLPATNSERWLPSNEQFTLNGNTYLGYHHITNPNYVLLIQSNINVVYPRLSPAEQPDIFGAKDEGSGRVPKGQVEIMPHSSNTGVEVMFTDESSRSRVLQATKNTTGEWVLSGNALGNLVTLDQASGKITLLPDAVRNGSNVTAYGLQSGRDKSDRVVVRAGSDIANLNEFFETLNDLLPDSPTVDRNDNNDIGVWTGGYQGENNDPDQKNGSNTALRFGRSDGLRNLIQALKEQERWESDTWVDTDDRAKLVLKTNEQDNIMRIYTSLGNMNSNHAVHAGILEILTQDGHDAIVIGGDLGTSGSSTEDARRYLIDMGEGHDILFVGATNDWFKVVQYYEKDATGSYTIPGRVDIIPYRQALPEGSRYLSSLDLYNDISNVRRPGGHIANANISMGNGDDAVIVSGRDSVTTAAIANAKIDLGEGNNRVIVAPNGVGTSYRERSAIGDNTVITAGDGDDYLQTALINGNAKINLGNGANTVKVHLLEGSGAITLGNGNDIVELDQIAAYATLFTSDGDDIVTVVSALRGRSVIDLGDGNDTFNWGFTMADGGFVKGGTGFDKIVLEGHPTNNQSPVGWWGGRAKHTNITTGNFSGIEEVILESNNVLDVYFSQLRDINGAHTHPKNGRKFSLIVSQKQDVNNKVDLGGGDLNRDEDKDLRDTSAGLGGSWRKLDETVVLKEQTYDIYRHSTVNDDTYDVWVQQGVMVI